MSYEGYREVLCANGHYHAEDVYSDTLETCHCGARFAHWNSVDITNGEDPEIPGTMPAPKEQIGADDQWLTDHYGNRYARAIPRYQPISGWVRLTTPGSYEPPATETKDATQDKAHEEYYSNANVLRSGRHEQI